MSRRKGTGSIFKPKGSRFWWIIYTSGGQRYFESSKSERKQDAQALLTDRLGDVGKGIPVSPKLGRIKLADGLKAVINDLRMNGRDSVVCARCKVICCGVEGHSNHIQRQIDKHIIRLTPASDTGYFHPDRLMSTITTSDLTAYASHRLAQGASAIHGQPRTGHDPSSLQVGAAWTGAGEHASCADADAQQRSAGILRAFRVRGHPHSLTGAPARAADVCLRHRLAA